ncbi:collagen-like protein [Lysinibacillus irui]|uniref:hypothetical protein n=1 Tax=Lysinibacillus irui TaxID=2998077 RepID=UPI003883F6D3
MARMREIGASLDKGYRDDLNYNFGLLEALIGEANGLTDNLREEMLGKINNLQQQIDMLTGENIGELLERLNDSIQQALTAAQEARTAKTATEEATALATTATELANASALLAKEKANYANEKAVLAQEAADNANQEASNLSQLKIDVVQVTQDANTATGNANQATQAAQTATDAINVVLPNVTGLVNLKEWSIETQYKKNNFVTLEGNGYMALRDNKGVKPPSFPVLSNTDWAMFVQKGEKGEQGTGVRILGTLPDESALPPLGEPGDAYLINGDLYVWSDTTNDWTNVGTIKGPKGDTGPQGPQGEQGPPGQDADLTEVNQEIANLQQTVTNNQQVVTEHLAQMATTEEAGHVMLVNDLITGGANKAASAETVKVLKQETDKKVQKNTLDSTNVMTNLNKWQFTKHFGETVFTRNDVSEVVELIIPFANAFSGTLELNLASTYANSNASGGAFIIFNLCLTPEGTLVYQDMNIITMSPTFAGNFYVGELVSVVGSKAFVIPIYKRKTSNPLTVEATFRLSGRGLNAEDTTKITLGGVYPLSSVISNPIQQSIFTHVGNSKDGLSVAITGKGVPTDKNAPFSTFIANVNAIQVGAPYYSGFVASTATAVQYYYTDGTTAFQFPRVSVTFGFKPQIVEVWQTNGTSVWSSTYIAEQVNSVPDTTRIAFFNKTTTAISTYNVKTPISNSGNTWTLDIPVQNSNSQFFVRAFGGTA